MKPADYSRMSMLQPAPYLPLRVTFLLIAHNNASCLAGTLESVWHEAGVSGGEIVLVDDGSTDGSDELCAEFAATRARVRFWRQSHCGLHRTLNMVAGSARGEWVRLCAGDMPLVPDSTQRLIAAAQRTGAGIACGGVIRCHAAAARQVRLSETRPGAETPRLHLNSLAHLVRSLDFPLSSVVYRQELVERALPLPADLTACPNLAILFSAAKRTTLAQLRQPVCIGLDLRPEARPKKETLTLQQTIRILQRHVGSLTGSQKRTALFKAAERTRHWLRRFSSERNSAGLQLWLLGVVLFGRLGVLDFAETLERLAQLCQHDLHAFRGSPLDDEATPGWVKSGGGSPGTAVLPVLAVDKGLLTQ
jgi:hypothetical protein